MYESVRKPARKNQIASEIDESINREDIVEIVDQSADICVALAQLLKTRERLLKRNLLVVQHGSVVRPLFRIVGIVGLAWIECY